MTPSDKPTEPGGVVERLAAAEVGSRELDAEIWCLFAPGGASVDADRHMFIYPDKSYVPVAIAPAYTTSLDAALALAERVLPEFDWRVSSGPKGYAAKVTQGPRRASKMWPGLGPTPALALCAATLRAHPSDGESK